MATKRAEVLMNAALFDDLDAALHVEEVAVPAADSLENILEAIRRIKNVSSRWAK